MRSRDLEIYKALLRNKLRHSLNSLSPSRRRAKSKKIIKGLLDSALFRKAKNIVMYASLPGEVPTRSLIYKALSLNKKVFLPRINRKSNELEVFEIRNPSKDLTRGHYGIWEPQPIRSLKGSPQDMDLVIVPGLGFDRSGARLGRVKGYFDRFLKKTIRATKVGLAFREQLLTRIPTNSRDLKVDKVITD